MMLLRRENREIRFLRSYFLLEKMGEIVHSPNQFIFVIHLLSSIFDGFVKSTVIIIKIKLFHLNDKDSFWCEWFIRTMSST